MSAAAVILLKRAKYLRAFREAQATSPDTAKPLMQLGIRDSFLFRRMVSRGVFVALPDGRYYLSEPEAQTSDARLWTTMLVLIILGLLILALTASYHR